MGHKYGFVTLLLLLNIVCVIQCDKCENENTVGTLLKIDSRRNDSGHWILQVELVHSDKGERKGDPWTVDVVHHTTSCGADTAGQVAIGATLVSPILAASAQRNISTTSYSHVGTTGLAHHHNKSLHFLSSNSTTTWDVARSDCENLNCRLLQSEIIDYLVTLYSNRFQLRGRNMHLGFRRSNETPFDLVDLSGTKMNKAKLRFLGAISLHPSATSACVRFYEERLATGPCDSRLDFICICHKNFSTKNEYTTEVPQQVKELHEKLLRKESSRN